MAINGGPIIIDKNNLVLHLDATNYKSYSGHGSIWYDLSGYNNHANLYNSPTYQEMFIFDGANQKATVEHSPELNLNSSFTISAFVKQIGNSFNNSYWNVVSKYSQFILGPNGNNRMAFLVNANGWEPSGYSSSSTWPNQDINFDIPNYYTGVYESNSGTLSFYINAVLTVSYNVGKNLSNDTGVIEIAKRDAGGNYFSGGVDAITLYNKALTINEISRNYNVAKARFNL